MCQGAAFSRAGAENWRRGLGGAKKNCRQLLAGAKKILNLLILLFPILIQQIYALL